MNYTFCQTCPYIKTCEEECLPYLYDEWERIQKGEEKNPWFLEIEDYAAKIINEHYKDLTTKEFLDNLKTDYVQIRKSNRKLYKKKHLGIPIPKFKLPKFEPFFFKYIIQKNGKIETNEQIYKILEIFCTLPIPERAQVAEYIHGYNTTQISLKNKIQIVNQETGEIETDEQILTLIEDFYNIPFTAKAQITKYIQNLAERQKATEKKNA